MIELNQGKAFTLIELLIVVAIIGILAAIAVPNFLNAQIRAKVAATQANMQAIATANSLYQVDNGSYMPICSGTAGYISGFENDFHLFTTPVAYLSSITAAIDPFGSKSQQGMHDAIQEYDKVFDYTPGFAEGIGKPFQNSNGKWIVLNADTYLLEGVGPDTMDSIYPSPCFGQPSCVFNLFSLYDCSNGLISPGDIIRLGGRVPQHAKEFF